MTGRSPNQIRTFSEVQNSWTPNYTSKFCMIVREWKCEFTKQVSLACFFTKCVQFGKKLFRQHLDLSQSATRFAFVLVQFLFLSSVVFTSIDPGQ